MASSSNDCSYNSGSNVCGYIIGIFIHPSNILFLICIIYYVYLIELNFCEFVFIILTYLRTYVCSMLNSGIGIR